MGEMRPIRLDSRTADRLLSGALSPDDAPPGYAGVSQLLAAAGSGLGAPESVPELSTVAAMEAAVLGHVTSGTAHEEKKMLSKVLTIKAAAVMAVVLSAGTAAAATGSLPGGAQSTASMVLAKIGISVPGSNNHVKGHAGSHGKGAKTSGHGHGPNSNADFGLCTAEEAHADSGHQPNAHATVFPPSTTCTSVTHPGQGAGNTSKAQDSSSSTTTERPNGPPPSTPAKPKNPGGSHGRP